jgi:hypothetical protein
MRKINKEDYPMVLDWSGYVNTRTKLLCKCQLCGSIYESTINKLDNKTRPEYCSKCNYSLSNYNRLEIDRSKYPMVLSWDNYKGVLTKLPCKCELCGDVIYRSISTINNQKDNDCFCKKCSGIKFVDEKNIDNFIKKRCIPFTKRNIDKEDYPMVLDWSGYINTQTKLPCKCQSCDKILYKTIHQIDQSNGVVRCRKCGCEKRKKTWINKYGVDNPLKMESTKEKRKKQSIEEYGVDHPFKLNEFQEHIKNKIYEKYSVKNPSKLQWVNDKKRKTFQKNIEKNVEKYIKFHQGKINNILNGLDISNYIISDVKRDNDLYYVIINDDYKLNVNTIYNRISYLNDIDKILSPMIFYQNTHFNNSSPNNTFKELLVLNNIEYTTEKWNLNESIIYNQLGSFRYDFCVGNILIEINPSSTHNSTWGFRSNVDMVPKNYHYNKSQYANKYGYQCIHVWDWDDKEKIINILKPKETLYARNLNIKEVGIQDCNTFFNLYHLQNSVGGTNIKCFVLTNEDEIIQAMAFGEPRYNKKYEWEILRLCTHKNYKVVGGTERLFNKFNEIYNPKSIISYCDLSKFNGDIYTKLNFNKISENVSKHWYNIKENIHITDNHLRKYGYDKLIAKYFDGIKYGKKSSNDDLMLSHGFVEIYDAGQATFVKYY